MFTGVKQILPVHEFHMLFKILVYNGCTVRSMLGCQCKGHEFKACHICRSNILFLHLVCAILTRQWFVKTNYNDKLKNQTLQPQTASDKHEVLVLVLFNTSSA